MICENVLSLMKKVNNNLVKVGGTAHLMKKAIPLALPDTFVCCIFLWIFYFECSKK